MSLGALIKQARGDAGKTLADLATAMGVSIPYLCDVEHDRRDLVAKRWPALVAVLPGLSLRALAEASIASGTVEIEARRLTKAQRAAMIEEIVGRATT